MAETADLARQESGPVVSPILTLPSEITSEIFLHCLPNAPGWPDPLNSREAPLLFMHVCAAWRNIATTTAALWKRLWIEFPTGRPHELVLELVERCLERSRGCPLAVNVYIKPIASDLINLSNRFIDIIQRHSSKMQCLDLWRVDIHHLALLNAREMQFPWLERLEISPHKWYTDSENPIRVFRNSPLLRRLELSWAIPLSLVDLPWQQLTHFTGQMYSVSSCFEALRTMPNMTHCKFNGMDDEISANAVLTVNLVHSRLQHLDIFNVNDMPLVHFIQFLTFPALETFKMDLTDPRMLQNGPQILNAFILLSPSLRQLTLRATGSRALRSGFIFHNLLLLTDLEIQNPSFIWIPDFFIALANPTFLPQLRSLSLSLHDKQNSDVVNFASIVQAAGRALEQRAGVGRPSPLRSLSLVFVGARGKTPHVEELELRLLREFKEGGADIHIGVSGQSLV